ncbi:LamG domain-containing protein [Patescibacteria group bacterium]|nr:LamG domain-containing protein [Patescibacteria group bacterium]
MNKKILLTISIIVVAIIGSLFLYSQNNKESSASVSRSGLTLDLDFGNNDGTTTPTVYDSSGFARHATAANAQTCNNSFCDFDGSEDRMTLTGTGVYNTSNVSIAIKFTPDFEADDGATHFLTDTSGTERYAIAKYNDNSLNVFFGNNVFVISVSLANFQSYWKVGKENIIVVSGTTGNNKIWLNGQKLTDDYSGTTAWTPDDVATIFVGSDNATNRRFDGRIHYLKVWNRLLTNDEVAILSADRETTAATAPRAGATGSSTGTLVGYWTMDADDINGAKIYEKSGTNASSTIIGNPTLSSGKIGQALDFDAASDYIIATSTAYDFTGAFTVSIWAKSDRVWPSDTSSNSFRGVVGKAVAGNAIGTSYVIDWYGDDGTTPTRVLRFSVSNGTTSYSEVFANFDFNSDWRHIVGVFNGSSLSLYVDGALTSSPTAFTGNINIVDSANFEIGRAFGSAYYWDGSLDDVRIYNYALSASEIANLYVSTKQNISRGLPREGLVGYWNMNADDYNGTTVFDKSGKGNHGTDTNMDTSNLTPGKIGQAMNFNGSDELVTVLDDSSLQFTEHDPFSLSLWFNGQNDGGTAELIVKRNVNNRYMIYLDASNQIGSQISDGSATILLTTSENVADGKWHHAVLTYDGINKGSIFVDNVSKDYDTASFSGLSTSGANLTIGQGQNGYFDGSIDEVMIYNRALSAEEVQDLYLYRWQYLR